MRTDPIEISGNRRMAAAAWTKAIGDDERRPAPILIVLQQLL